MPLWPVCGCGSLFARSRGAQPIRDCGRRFALAWREMREMPQIVPSFSRHSLWRGTFSVKASAANDPDPYDNPARLFWLCWLRPCPPAAALVSLPRAGPSKAQWRSPVSSRPLRVCPLGHDACPRARILPPGCWEICLRARPRVLARWSLFSAYTLLKPEGIRRTSAQQSTIDWNRRTKLL